MKKVLFISYLFPPVGGTGVIRVTKFVKYLARFGYQPRILTVKKWFYSTMDESLLNEIPREIKIDRVSYFDPALWFDNYYWHLFFKIIYLLFLVPDYHILWYWSAIARARKIIKEENIDIVFTSSLAYSDHLIALSLKKLTGVKWVADFRDEWTTNPGLRFPTFLHRYIAKRMELKVVNNADHIISVSKPIIDYFRHLLPNQNKFSVITNGYDPDDLPTVTYRKKKYCQITYAGALYGKIKKIANFFKEIVEELDLPRLKIAFWGNEKRVAHKKAIKIMVQSDILLLILSPDFRPGVYTGKLFEYLSVRRPILALAGQETEAAKLIKNLKAGKVVSPTDKNLIKKKISEMYSAWQQDELAVPVSDIDRFNRVELTGKLAKIFDKILLSGHTKKRNPNHIDNNPSHKL